MGFRVAHSDEGAEIRVHLVTAPSRALNNRSSLHLDTSSFVVAVRLFLLSEPLGKRPQTMILFDLARYEVATSQEEAYSAGIVRRLRKPDGIDC